MKRILSIVFPLLLAVAILGGSAWYFLVYQESLGDSYYIARAQEACEAGKYDRALTLYEKALEQNSQLASTHIALAETYVLLGNYSRAEYTLACAIMELPEEISLYVALSRVYVQQDKLLDAENLLSNVSYESVHQALQALRPQAPQLVYEPGAYSEYIALDISYDGGTCYVSTDGAYPSTQSGGYEEAIILEAGSTQIQAIVVSEDGLVSTVTTGSYDIGHVDEEVNFTDSVLESYVRELLDCGEAITLRTSDLWSITTLMLPQHVQSLEDLQWFQELQTLYVEDYEGQDFTSLSNITSLRVLYIVHTSISAESLAAIGTMMQLEELYLIDCGISTVEPLENLTALQCLDISDNSVGNIDALANMTELYVLKLSNNALVDVSALSNLTQLKELYLTGNAIADILSLTGLTCLERLDISDCNLSDISPLAGLLELEYLYASGNQIFDISCLAGCIKLYVLDLSSNQLSQVDALADLEQLHTLLLDENLLMALPMFSPDCALVFFSATHNMLTDISGLTGLYWLNYVDLDYNSLTSLDALSSCQNLVEVNAFENPISDVSALTKHGILVNYSPGYSAAS